VIVTGGAGFIGSAIVWKLNEQGIDDVLIVDELGTDEKWKNLVGLRFADYLHKDEFLKRVEADAVGFDADAVVHMGACSATTERDADYLMRNNFRYTDTLAHWSLRHGSRFVYASSAATYGEGEHGFDDRDPIDGLKPLNMYGYSKHLFDLKARREGMLDHVAGLKFFNVFGPNEYHKADMTSVVYKAFGQIAGDGVIRLFQSYRPEYGHGDQLRDFVYVKDCVDVIWWLLQNPQVNGLFNVGTGQARSWNDLARAIFAALGREPQIEYIPMPEALQGKYQYFTEAKGEKLLQAGCDVHFRPLEDSVADYVQGYLQKGPGYLTTL
jgi:ADP-L-glycero-D-manno-heptose 6-epimerase